MDRFGPNIYKEISKFIKFVKFIISLRKANEGAIKVTRARDYSHALLNYDEVVLQIALRNQPKYET